MLVTTGKQCLMVDKGAEMVCNGRMKYKVEISEQWCKKSTVDVEVSSGQRGVQVKLR